MPTGDPVCFGCWNISQQPISLFWNASHPGYPFNVGSDDINKLVAEIKRINEKLDNLKRMVEGIDNA